MSGFAESNEKAALELAAAGFAIFPCRPNKVPYIKGWQEQASCDQSTIRNWWKQFSDAIPGLPTGKSGLLVIDCDVKRGIEGPKVWNEICDRACFDQSACLIVETPTGGRHIYFRQIGRPLLGNTAGKLAPGIDTRGDGGYVVAPGAVLPDGRSYKTVNGSTSFIVALPDGLRSRLFALASNGSVAKSPYATAILRDEASNVRNAEGGSRNSTLNNAAFLVGTVLHLGLSESEARSELEAAGLACGLQLNEIRATIESGLVSGHLKPRLAQTTLPTHGSPSNFDEAIIRRVSDVAAIPVTWVWRNRIAVGKLTLIAGDPGLGKSQLSMFVASCVTTGRAWPNDEGAPAVGSVVLLSCEDDIADTIRPRLEAAGADLSRVQVFEAIRGANGSFRGVSLQRDLQHLEALIDRLNDVALVIVDPITAYLGSTDSHKTGDVRGLLAPLQELAARRCVAIVAISHLNKSAGGGKSINAVTGSGAFVAASRATFLVTQDKTDEERRLFIEVKNNIGRSSGLAFTVQSHTLAVGIETSFIQFEPGTVQITADEAISHDDSVYQFSAVGEAVEFLKAQFFAGPVAANDILMRAKTLNIAEKTLRRAARKLGILKQKDGLRGGWLWNWPPAGLMAGSTNIAKGAPPTEMGTFQIGWPSSKGSGPQ